MDSTSALCCDPGRCGFSFAPHVKKIAQGKQQRLNNWAKSEGVTIIRHRGARFYEGPSAWRRGENQDTLRIGVRNSKGRVHVVWLTSEDTGGVLQKTSIEITNVTWG